MLRVVVLSVIVILNIVLQGTFFEAIAIGNISPNLLIITAVSFSLIRGKDTGMIVGFFLGLLQDIYFGNVIGFYALIYMYSGYACGFFRKSFYRDSLIIPVAIIGLADICSNFLIFIFTYLFRGRTDIGYYFGTIILPESTYTILISIFIYKLYFYINSILEKYEALKGGSNVA